MRTDHWFGLTGGGSVAHTSGVINGLRENGIDISIVSTDQLLGVSNDDRFALVAPCYDNRAIIQGAAELDYNDVLIRDLEPRIAQDDLPGAHEKGHLARGNILDMDYH